MISGFRSAVMNSVRVLTLLACTNTLANEAQLQMRIVDQGPLVSGQIVTVELSLLSEAPIVGSAKFALPPLDFGVWLEQSRASYNGFALHNGRRMPTLVTSYAVWIQKVGRFQLAPVQVSAPVLIEGRRQYLQAETPALSMLVQYPQIQGQPAFQSMDFLVAARAQISSFVDLPTELKVGQVIEQTLTIEAQGALPVSFPELAVASATGYRIDQLPTSSSVEYTRGVVSSTQVVKLRYTLLEGGAVTIPSYTVDWWDTGLHQFKTLRSQAYELRVNASEVRGGEPIEGANLLWLLAGLLFAWIALKCWASGLILYKCLKTPVLPERLNP